MGIKVLKSRLQGDTLVLETSDGTASYDKRFLVAALLLQIARGDGRIEPEEAAQIIDLVEAHFNLGGAESLEIITRAMLELDEKPELLGMLMDLAPTFSDREKEDVALMGLKVVAADGRHEFDEMEMFNDTVNAMGISREIVHKAFDRYFAQTLPEL